jgi:hypothetical protein
MHVSVRLVITVNREISAYEETANPVSTATAETTDS